MIFSYGARNYFSFREGMVVSFELNSKVPRAVSQGLKATTVLGVKGANASGKTNVLKCLAFITSFITTSFNNDENDGLNFDPFFKSDKSSEFYIDFESEGVRYVYELEATKSVVIREAIYKKVSRRTLLVERVGNEVKYRVNELQELDLIELKSNASLLSSAYKYKFKNQNLDILNIIGFFVLVRGNVSVMGVSDSYFNHKLAARNYFNNPEALEFAKAIIVKSDLGISDIEIHEAIASNGEKEYFPIFLHNTDCGPDEDRWLTPWDESSGTMALFNKLGLYWVILEHGGVLVMDEFDINCHSMLLPNLVNLFLDKSVNKKSAQFIFTAHSTEIIDVLGKYRTILVNKEKSESYAYRLDEIPGDLIRNDRSISALYREGKIGGVPKYGE